jgi:hypothetical protein
MLCLQGTGGTRPTRPQKSLVRFLSALVTCAIVVLTLITGKRSRIPRSGGFEGGASKHSVTPMTAVMITQLAATMLI